MLHALAPQPPLATRPLTTARSWRPLPFGARYEEAGCSLNRIGIDELFQKYAACGFLYPAKIERLRAFWPAIAANWEKSMISIDGEPLNHVVVYDDGHGGWASISAWETGTRALHSQHLVSTGRPEATQAVLLSAQSEMWQRRHRSATNWFRAENRFPARVFGSCERSLGPLVAQVLPFAYLKIDRGSREETAPRIAVQRCTERDQPAVAALAARLCGSVQAHADDWSDGDLELTELDERYKRAGLRRYRHVFVAYDAMTRDYVGLAVAYRGPLGLSLSFLENRCELWLAPELSSDDRRAVTTALLARAEATYQDFELQHLLVTTDERTATILRSAGADTLVDYNRSTWLAAGFESWFRHVESLYARACRVSSRHSASNAS